MLPTIYGFASAEDVERLIQARIAKQPGDDIAGIASLLGQSVFAILEINKTIPVHSKNRHLVASALENFADGKG